jgi:adenosine kinase
MNILICGSVAYDTIMVFPDHFKNHILPDQIHILNVAFLVPDMRREFGGCAGNIAYNLKMLESTPLIMATVGAEDYQPYASRLEKLELPQDHIKQVADTFTAQAFITTDLDDNQITAFHPGAMNYSDLNHVGDAKNVGLGIISPDGREGMLQHAKEFAEAGIPFIFDPGQGLPMFNGQDLQNFIKQASYVTVNDYEAQMLQEKTGKKVEELARSVKAFIVTLGSKGSVIYLANGQQLEIPCVKVNNVVDPTGCGDAYRAGLLYGISTGMDWEVTGRLASLMGALKIEQRGAQNHQFNREEIDQWYQENFNSHLW